MHCVVDSLKKYTVVYSLPEWNQLLWKHAGVTVSWKSAQDLMLEQTAT